MQDARNPDLEAAIAANPIDREPYVVLADWLQVQGDPRGELMALQLTGKDTEADAVLAKHRDYFLGPLAAHATVYDEGGNNSSSSLRTPEQDEAWQQIHRQAFRWKNGFIHYVRLSHDEYQDGDTKFDGQIAEVLSTALDHPSARFVVEFAFQSNGDPNEADLQDVIDVLAEKAPPSTRKLTFGDNVDQISWHHTGNLNALWARIPNLQTLEIETGEFEVGTMHAPALERAIFITGGLSASCGRGIATAHMPNIRHLEIYYGDENYGGTCKIDDVMPLLERDDLTQLRTLGLKNSLFANDIARMIGSARCLPGLLTLDLSLGAMTDEGAQFLAEGAPRLAHLKTLDLRRNFLTAAGIALVKNLCPEVITDAQEEPYRRSNGELNYFVSVAE
ncbi:MAG: TIGR02996 domain-containing protein [Kofleriaceae bacterium]